MRRFQRVVGQPFSDLRLHLGQSGLHRLDHADLGIGLRIADGLDIARQLVLPLGQSDHILRHASHLMGDVIHRLRGLTGTAQGCDQQDQDQHQRGQPAKHGQHSGIAEWVRGITNLDHVRPNNLSISDSFSST